MALSLGSSCLMVKVLEGALKGMIGMSEPLLVSADIRVVFPTGNIT